MYANVSYVPIVPVLLIWEAYCSMRIEGVSCVTLIVSHYVAWYTYKYNEYCYTV
jgi:hypothetical protein